MKIGVGIITRNRNKYLDFFINYYLNTLKFDKVFIIDNNDEGNLYISNHPQVSIYYNYNQNILNNMRQVFDYKLLFYQAINSNIDYLLLCDDDEFLYLGDYIDIHDFINDYMVKPNNQVVHFIWKCYDDNSYIFNNELPYPIEDVISNFAHPIDISFNGEYNIWGEEIFWTKYIVDCNFLKQIINNIDFEVINSDIPLFIHYFQLQKIIDIKYNSLVLDNNLYNKYYLRHYRTKNFEEYLLNKLNNVMHFQNPTYKSLTFIDNYFKFNIKTNEKLEKIHQIYKKYNIDLNK